MRSEEVNSTSEQFARFVENGCAEHRPDTASNLRGMLYNGRKVEKGKNCTSDINQAETVAKETGVAARPMGTDRFQYETDREIAELLTEIRHAQPFTQKPNSKISRR
jgi:hypothetical protein